MKNRNLHSAALSLCLVLGWQAAPALGQFVSGSDGTDGPLNVTADTVINLALAATGPWDTTPHAAGVGVYDPVQWAVVYHYTTIDIAAGATVTFQNHPKGAPVIWLATGDVTIAGSVRLDGADGSIAPPVSYAVPGPGGFSGGIFFTLQSSGFGPGGSLVNNGAGYGTVGGGGAGGAIYGTASILPLIGGSGGTSWGTSSTAGAGGAGGGAILIASSGNISLPDAAGGIFAIGGNAMGGGGASGSFAGSGSGGGIRLITNDVSGSGLLRATGGSGGQFGGKGRIRVEATTYNLDDLGDPPFAITTTPGSVFPDATTPSLRVLSVNSTPVPADPEATVRSTDVCFTSTGAVTIAIEARNVAPGAIVQVRLVPAFGIASVIINSTPLAGSFALSNATAQFAFANGATEVQLSVVVP